MDRTGLVGLAVAIGVLLVATGFGMWWRRGNGRPTAAPAAARSGAGPVLAELGVDLTSADVAVTLLQFSSAFCAPCRATRVTCARVAADQPGVRHLEVDAEQQLAAVRALGIWRTPTVLVVAGGQVTARIVGQPTRAQVDEAISPLLEPVSS